MNNHKNILLKSTSTIREALNIIDSGAMRIALVTDNDEKLIGTLTDGDIRRGILNNLDLSDSIESIIFRTPTVCNVSDNKEKILEIALEKDIYQIPIVDHSGRLVGIEKVNALLKPEGKNNRVVLMVGGLGSRLRPLTDHIPKPMLKVGDKPILETIILNFKKYGFINIVLCVSYKSEIIEAYFGDGSTFGVNIEYIHEEKRMGTAGALSLMQDKYTEPFFVMNGDLLTNLNFEHMMEYHLNNHAIATMGVREYDFQVPYGVVNVNGKEIISIEEKPTHRFFVSGGVYILDSQVLEFIPNNEYYDMPTLFEKLMEQKMKSISFPIREYWLDIGRLEEFKRANNEYHEVF
ncbi:MAG TPA: CBS domain-containing protein [Campylobacterales bacterium]|nr:CBS domain-containing protein [Campylobacterales bacterium]